MLIKMIKTLINLILINIKLFILKLFNFRTFKYNLFNFISFNCSINLSNKGHIILGKKVKINSGSVISALNNGMLKIGYGSFVNNNCQIVSHKKIEIGNDVMIGPNVVIVAHDHKYNANGILKKEYKTDDIYIGNNVWIGANCVILKGTIIEDNSIVAAGSVIHGKYNQNSLILQKKETIIRQIKEEK